MAAATQDFWKAIEAARKYFSDPARQGATAYFFGFGPFRWSEFQPGGQYYSIGAGAPQQGGGGGGGGAGAGAGAPASSLQLPTTALAATQAGGNPGQMGGMAAGGAPQLPGNEVRASLSERQDEWRGIDTYTPEEKLPFGYSPEATNWDGLRKIGSMCVRGGAAKFRDDRDSVSSGALDTGYAGLGIAVVPNASGTLPDLALISFLDTDLSIGSMPGGSDLATYCGVVDMFTRWGEPLDLKTLPGPKLTVTQVAGPRFQVTVDYTNLLSSRAGLRKTSIKSLTVRYNGPGTIGGLYTYPLDPDSVNGENAGRAGTALADRSTWDGTSQNVVPGANMSLGVYYISAWAHTLLGTSERSICRIELV